jgi:hypothetical protein
MFNGKLFGSKYFSILFEDYVELNYSEEFLTVSIPSQSFMLKIQPGINSSSVTDRVINTSLKRLELPFNGNINTLDEGIYIFNHLFFFFNLFIFFLFNFFYLIFLF